MLSALRTKCDDAQMQAYNLNFEASCKSVGWWGLHESIGLLGSYIENEDSDGYEKLGCLLYFHIKTDIFPFVTKTAKRLKQVQETLANLSEILSDMEYLGFHNLKDKYEVEL